MSARRLPTRVAIGLTGTLVWIALALLVAWCAAAVWYDGPANRTLAAALAAAVVVIALALAWWVRPLHRAAAAVGAFGLLVVFWWTSIPPRNDRDWQPDVARNTTAEVDGDLLRLHDVRNFDYRSETDFTERWEDRTYHLAKLRGVDLYLSYWGSPMIAHTIMSWDFGDEGQLAISIETRKEKGEVYDAIRGFFRQYELHYVVADERDVVRLRPNYRGETTYVYRLQASPERARAVLLDYLKTINALAKQPVWYNALTHNCTTTIRMHTRHTQENAPPFDWRILANGYADQMLYERGALDTSVPFAALRERANIDARSKAADQDPDYSRRIRE